MTGKSEQKDLIVIGGGAGGLALAERAACLGLKVGIVDKYPQLGGDCLHLGCVPSKTLLAVAQFAHNFSQATKQGLSSQVKIDWDAIKLHLMLTREKIQPRYSQEKFEQLGCEVLIGAPKFITPKKLSIVTTDSNTQQPKEITWTAKKMVIATGSRPMMLPITGLSASDIHTNETIYQLPKLPESMVILGAGVTGIEFAQGFQRLGVKVTVLVHSERILRTLDIQASALLTHTLKNEGMSLLTNAKITEATKNHQNKITLTIQKQDENFILETDIIFMATGRLPNIENLGLEKIGIACTKQGIVVDDYFRSNLKHIYAVGDVIAWPHRYTHMAEYGAEVVYQHLCLKNFAPKANLKWVPGVIFTNPEMASVGLTEQEAKIQKLSYEILFWEFKELDRAVINNQPEGFIKLLLVKQKVIGATIVCERAGEILAEVGLLVQKNLSINAILDTIHAYPTWAEGLRRAVQDYIDKQKSPKTSIKNFLRRIVVRFF